MSNLIKSGFVTLSQDNTLVIDANKHKIIKNVEESVRNELEMQNSSVEDALAEAMIDDAGLNDMDNDENFITMDTKDFPNAFGDSKEEIKHVMDRVIKSAHEEAEQIVNKAHEEAEQLRAVAYEEAELIKKKAKEEGYQEGYSEGNNLANQELNEKQEQLDQYIQETAEAFERNKEDMIIDTENHMIDFLCRIIPKLTGVSIEGYKSVLLYMINEAMKDLDNSKHFTIKISSFDYSEIIKHKDEIYGALNPNIELEIYEDAKLLEKQCMIETDNGIVDISLDVQINNLIQTLELMKRK